MPTAGLLQVGFQLMPAQKTIQKPVAGMQEVGQKNNHPRMMELKEDGRMMKQLLMKEHQLDGMTVEQKLGMLQIKVEEDGKTFKAKDPLLVHSHQIPGSLKIMEKQVHGFQIHKPMVVEEEEEMDGHHLNKIMDGLTKLKDALTTAGIIIEEAGTEHQIPSQLQMHGRMEDQLLLIMEDGTMALKSQEDGIMVVEDQPNGKMEVCLGKYTTRTQKRWKILMIIQDGKL